MSYTVDKTIRHLKSSNLWHESPHADPGERALWRAIIVQALMDAASRSQKPEALFHKREAIAWLEGSSRDFATVCECAGFNPSYVRRMAKRALLSGCKWRASPGQGKQAKKSRPAPPDDEHRPGALILAFPPAERCAP